MLDTDMVMKVLAGVVDPEVEGGGSCPRVNMDIMDLEAGRESTIGEWEAAIEKASRRRRVVFTDGSKMQGVKGAVGGGWFGEGGANRGSMPVGPKAMVWDGELAGIEGALSVIGKVPVLVLADSWAALQAIKVAGTMGRARTRGLREVVRLISEIEGECGEKSVSLAWSKPMSVLVAMRRRIRRQRQLRVLGEGGL